MNTVFRLLALIGAMALASVRASESLGAPAPAPESFNFKFEPTASGAFLQLSEFASLKAGVNVPWLGKVYPSAGARWRVNESDRYLTRALSSFRGGPTLKQSYEFRDGRDLYENAFERPMKRFLSKVFMLLD